MKEPRLSLAFVRQVRTPGKYYDSFGLILVVSAGGAKRWIQRLTVNGRRRDIGLGSALTTTPAAARAMAAKNREVARAGGNPLAGVKDRPVPTPRKGMSLAGFSRAVHLRGLALGDKRAARERYATLSRHLLPQSLHSIAQGKGKSQGRPRLFYSTFTALLFFATSPSFSCR